MQESVWKVLLGIFMVFGNAKVFKYSRRFFFYFFFSFECLVGLSCEAFPWVCIFELWFWNGPSRAQGRKVFLAYSVARWKSLEDGRTGRDHCFLNGEIRISGHGMWAVLVYKEIINWLYRAVLQNFNEY